MALTGVEFPRFGGLDLRDDPQEAGVNAIDMLNIDIDRVGRIRTRDGYAKYSTAANAARLDSLTYVEGYFAAYSSSNNKAHVYNDSGGLVGSSAALSTAFACSSFVVYKASALVQYIYGNQGNAANTILRHDFATFTYPAVGYQSRFVAVQPRDNRLVLCGTGEAGAVGERIRFSGASTPETFGANDWVDLQASVLTGTAVFGDQLFVFSYDKFYVFYGNSVSGSGTPVFNYRTVDTGVGLATWASGACCASPNGIYFIGEDGVYLTTGGPPVKVSAALDPLFDSKLSSYYQGFAASKTGGGSIAWQNGRLYLALETGTSYADPLFVLDEVTGNWMVWSVPAGGITAGLYNESVFKGRIFFTYGTGTNDIGVLTPTVTTDVGTAIASRYRTGFWNPGAAGSESVVREWLIDGTGSVTWKTAVNDAATLGTGATVTLGTSPAVAQGRDRRAVRGRNVSLEISGSGPWSVSRVTANLRGQSWAGKKAT